LQSAIDGPQDPFELPEPILSEDELGQLQETVAKLPVAAALQSYMVRVAHATRVHPHVTLGVSPRGLLVWQRAAQARAFLHERSY